MTKKQAIHSIEDPYRMEAAKVMELLGTSKKGITETQAGVRARQMGVNQLVGVRGVPLIVTFLRQFKDLMIILLLLSAGISLYLDDQRTAVILACLVLFNASIGYFQEHKAERIMRSLEKLVIPEAKVIRSGTLISVHSMEIVPGDVVYVEEGDSVPADLRLFEESELATNDFALTGESNPSRKFTHAMHDHVELGDRHNLVFMGTTVAIGHGYGIAVATGMQTELGKIAHLSQATKNTLSPLQREMNHIATRITQGTLVLGTILVLVALRADLPLQVAFAFAIGIASAMIPQGLPAEVNTSLAQAAAKLARAKALVKKLSAVETLGATNVICTDKTGTLTKNEMTVEHLWIGGTLYHTTGAGYETNGTITDAIGRRLTTAALAPLQSFFKTGVFASNATINPPDSEHANWYCLGDPTEGALVTLARKAGIDTNAIEASSPELKEFAFDSARKRMSSVRDYDGKLHVFTKGAPESVLAVSKQALINGKVVNLTATLRQRILAQHQAWAEDAMRNLAYAHKQLPINAHVHSLTMDEAESDLIFAGMVSMIDPLRPEVAKAMMAAHSAHIKVSIITGDYAPTARAIAVKAKLADSPEDLVVVPGLELRVMKDQKIVDLVRRGGVIFSRVSPEDKLRIVSLVKASGQVVAVTGDGINDAPALKMADIGVAMGRTGTDVAKQSADIILLDDSFNTLVGAVQAGRVIFQNIRKATIACLSSNAGELVVVLISLAAKAMYGIPLAITAVLILAVDLIAELFPIAALGWDPAEDELMHEPPREANHHILNFTSIVDLAWTGLFMGGLAYVNYLFFFVRHDASPRGLAESSALYAQATVLTYVTIVLCQFVNILSRRTKRFVLGSYLWSNRRLWIAFGVSIFCVFNIVYNPWINRYLGSEPLAAGDWLWALIAALIYGAFREGMKRFKFSRT